MATPRFEYSSGPVRRFVATALVGLACALVQPAHAFPGGHAGMAGRGELGAMAQLLERVDASAEQKAQIKLIMQTARNDLGPVIAQLRGLRDQSAALFTQPAVDAHSAEELRLQMQALQGQFSKRKLQAKVDASRVLTPEQRSKMAELMKMHQAMAVRHRAEAESLTAKPGAAK